ncbi:hypothetical protein HED55_15175 [Ochrobactrum haematophilum]|uniref:Uncharacterized protein n=1 Tax=Brucella haematophila TaxID=419474 RepID=A0ABX1DTG5_9HYPH|nr:hypothetical protein [Brucella haematophila]
MSAGNSVTVARNHGVTGINGEDADCHEHDRGDHQDGKKGGMLGRSYSETLSTVAG